MGRGKGELKRRTGYREPAHIFVVVCEDELAAPQFFGALGALCDRRKVVVSPVGGGGDPSNIAKTCLEEQQRLRRTKVGAKEEVWAVFDRDEHDRYDEAVRTCSENGIYMGRSDPCFEVWLILRYGTYDKPCSRHDVQRDLKAVCKGYDPQRNKTTDMVSEIIPNLSCMIRFSEKRFFAREEEGSPFSSPSDTIFCLVKLIQYAASDIDTFYNESCVALRKIALRVS